MTTTIQFAECVMRVNHADRFIETIFPDGLRAEARPNNQPEDVLRAHDLGYRGDTWAMSLDHEPLHTFVGELYGWQRSVILWNVAHNNPRNWPEWGREEEGFVTSLQRYLRTGERDALVWGLFTRANERLGLYPSQVRWMALGLLSEVHKEN